MHDLERKILAGRVGMGNSLHVSRAFAQSRISEGYGGVVAIKKLVYFLALLKSCKCTELPEYGSNIRRCP